MVEETLVHGKPASAGHLYEIDTAPASGREIVAGPALLRGFPLIRSPPAGHRVECGGLASTTFPESSKSGELNPGINPQGRRYEPIPICTSHFWICVPYGLLRKVSMASYG
jgi:hypothetical protein